MHHKPAPSVNALYQEIEEDLLDTSQAINERHVVEDSQNGSLSWSLEDLAAARPGTGDWTKRLSTVLSEFTANSTGHERTAILPCVIQGRRSIVFERGLGARSPQLLAYLTRFAPDNGLHLQEDRRSQDLPVKHDRRKNNPDEWSQRAIVALAGHFDDRLIPSDETVVGSEAAVARHTTHVARSLLFRAPASQPVRDEGKRFSSEPREEAAALMEIVSTVHRGGTPTRVSSNVVSPLDICLDASIMRYDYTYPALQTYPASQSFSYFEGEGFHALGYHHEGKVLINVLLGGGLMTSPRLWGGYQQVLNDPVDLQILIGESDDDMFGMLFASYSVDIARIPTDDNKNLTQ